MIYFVLKLKKNGGDEEILLFSRMLISCPVKSLDYKKRRMFYSSNECLTNTHIHLYMYVRMYVSFRLSNGI